MAKTPYQCPKCWEAHHNGSDSCPTCGPGQQIELCQQHMTGYSPHCRRCQVLVRSYTPADNHGQQRTHQRP